MDQESEKGLAGSPVSSSLAGVLQASAAASHLKVPRRPDLLPNSQSSQRQDSRFHRLLDRGPPFLTALNRRLPPGLCHVGLSTMAACFIKASKPRREKTSRLRIRAWYNLISAVIPHDSCSVLFLRSKSLEPAHTEGISTRRQESLRAI